MMDRPMSNSPLANALLESAHDAVWVVSGEQTVTQFNRVFARLCAKVFHREPVRVDIALAEILDDAARELCVDLYGRALEGRAVSADARFMVDGMSRSFIISAAAVSDGKRVAFTAHDVTEVTRRAREDVFELSLTRLFFEGEKPLDST